MGILDDRYWELDHDPVPCEKAGDSLETVSERLPAPFWAFSCIAGVKNCDNFFGWEEVCCLQAIAEGCAGG